MSVPQGWRSVTLGDVCEFKYGKSLPESARAGGHVPVFGSNGEVGRHDQPLTEGPTIVIGRKGSFGEVNYSAVGCWPIDTTYFVDDTATDADLRWLTYRLSALGLNRLNRAAAVPGLNREDAYRQRLLLPPLPEQRRIAEILDKADALRARRRAALAQLDTLTQSIFLDMFGDPATNPKGLALLPLGDVADVATGSTPSREAAGYFGGGIPWVKTTEVQGRVIRETEETLTEAGLRAIRGKLHPVDSIVIAMYGQGKTRGQCALLGVDAAVNQACAVIHPSPMFNSSFMLVQLLLAYERLRALGRGGNQENLNLELVRSFRLFVPPLALQSSFVDRLRVVQKAQVFVQSSLDALHALFASLQHHAFRGEL